MGFIRTLTEIKLVLLYVLNRLSAPVGLAQLIAAAQVDDGFTYFDAVQAIAELISTQHAAEQLSGARHLYSGTEKGLSDGTITESDIPYSVRLKLDATIGALRKEMERSRMVAVVRSHEN
ncbi:MAG: DUF4364 family protein [Oscillospiraceae bacterium]|jgi:hypothetical protein|nr:DUF4364 family protein [Oscillospiraceae bacterium]